MTEQLNFEDVNLLRDQLPQPYRFIYKLLMEIVNQCGSSGPPNKQVADMVRREKERVEEEGAPIFLPSVSMESLELGNITFLTTTQDGVLLFVGNSKGDLFQFNLQSGKVAETSRNHLFGNCNASISYIHATGLYSKPQSLLLSAATSDAIRLYFAYKENGFTQYQLITLPSLGVQYLGNIISTQLSADGSTLLATFAGGGIIQYHLKKITGNIVPILTLTLTPPSIEHFMFRFPSTNIIGIPASHGTPAFPIQSYQMESTGLDQVEYTKFKALENWFKKEADAITTSVVNEKERAVKSEGKKRMFRPASTPGSDTLNLRPSSSEGKDLQPIPNAFFINCLSKQKTIGMWVYWNQSNLLLRYTHGKLVPQEKVEDKWLVTNPMIKQQQEFTLTSITSAVCDEELNYFATGHKDGCIFVWSNRTGLKVCSITHSEAVTKRILPRHSYEVSSLVFWEDKQLYSTDIRFHVNIYNLKDGSIINSIMRKQVGPHNIFVNTRIFGVVLKSNEPKLYLYTHAGRMAGKLVIEDTWKLKTEGFCSHFSDGKFVVIGQTLKNKKKRRATEEITDHIFIYDIKDWQQKHLQNKLKDEQAGIPYGFRFWDAAVDSVESEREQLIKKKWSELKSQLIT